MRGLFTFVRSVTYAFRRLGPGLLLFVCALLLWTNLVRIGAFDDSYVFKASAASVSAVIADSNITSTTGSEQECGQNGTFQPVGVIDITSLAPGLTTVIDQPDTYTLRAGSLAGLRTQLKDCHPSSVDEFAATTDYALNWQYDWSMEGGICTLRNVRVGLHINQLMPTYAPTAHTSAHTVTSWNTFAANLTAHEAGHIALDTQYAAYLTEALQNLNGDCEHISTTAEATAQTHVSILQTANDAYDTRTNHGMTQGAVL